MSASSDHDQKIRERAYELWEKAGQPADRDDEFWHQAREQIPHPPEAPESDPGTVGPKAKSDQAVAAERRSESKRA